MLNLQTETRTHEYRPIVSSSNSIIHVYEKAKQSDKFITKPE